MFVDDVVAIIVGSGADDVVGIVGCVGVVDIVPVAITIVRTIAITSVSFLYTCYSLGVWINSYFASIVVLVSSSNCVCYWSVYSAVFFLDVCQELVTFV